MKALRFSACGGVAAYLGTMFLHCLISGPPGTGISNSWYDTVVLCGFFGPFMWLPYLVAPAVILPLTALASRKRSAKAVGFLLFVAIGTFGLWIHAIDSLSEQFDILTIIAAAVAGNLTALVLLPVWSLLSREGDSA
ncbi:MAG: hypothetical protein GY906_06645 [bacterium]|nr:hypothetical protein [bacterium]